MESEIIILNGLKVISLIENSLFQLTKCNTDLETVLCGVPQGSILGPLLFLIFVNDLNQATSILNPIMFADDTNLFYSNKNIDILFEIVNKELVNINNWFIANKLSLNASKS